MRLKIVAKVQKITEIHLIYLLPHSDTFTWQNGLGQLAACG